ncbi:hypothetical protein DITRI_Ditri13aG0088700 [Diplodiscus trichospermus]
MSMIGLFARRLAQAFKHLQGSKTYSLLCFGCDNSQVASAMDHSPIRTCILKMNVKCENCQRKLKKTLQKIHGVHSINIDANEGKVEVSSTVDPNLFIAMLAKAGENSRDPGAETSRELNQSGNIKMIFRNGNDLECSSGEDHHHVANINMDDEQVTQAEVQQEVADERAAPTPPATPSTPIRNHCGDADVGSSYCCHDRPEVKFDCRKGSFGIRVPDVNSTDASKIQNGGAQECFLIELNFPTIPITKFNSAGVSAISNALNGATLIDIKRTTTGDDVFVLLSSGKSVIELEPQFDDMLKCPGRGLIVTEVAPADSEFDFISQFFCPKYGVNEDLVSGSAHCALAPYWSKKLGKRDFNAYQASARGGILNLHLDEKNQRVLLRGKAVIVMEGTLLV